MIEVVLKNYLESALTAPVYLEKPISNIPELYVVIEKTGSSERDLVVNTTMAIQSYGPSLYAAAQLNERVKETMRGSTQLKEISKAALNSDYNYTDITTKEYRYQAVFDVVTHI